MIRKILNIFHSIRIKIRNYNVRRLQKKHSKIEYNIKVARAMGDKKALKYYEKKETQVTDKMIELLMK